MTIAEAPPVTIRPVERADLLEVIRIERAAFPQPWPYGAFEDLLAEPGFLVADAGDPPGQAPEVVGYVVGDCVAHGSTSIGHVKDLAVRRDRRGEGIGSELLERALVVLADHGADTVKLEVRKSNDAARELYASFGFERLRTVPNYYVDGEDALVLVRRP